MEQSFGISDTRRRIRYRHGRMASGDQLLYPWITWRTMIPSEARNSGLA
ncbi:hypothetical protein Ab1vBOLIVR5_gp104c [Agrobacterium phage OLIVR5]|uniref:Uncharacterized protein n=1 Tax=Agrobacterium phage OLIVR5 TaxID=2723773 RepID=A0A858MSN2_9CAUD|nr:hypothetical protein KNU99_gp104 [Agrobacterium phage OLIVR5]QIW87752.1 hypothetical protein Ab1vBOLIVR5_gp104c [Agrobacterium phage OLIVR5]QIW88014.1 hypothetical protein Ab1vBOLIVR6_gp107c [Agrobacterium phage OLIVR6]